MTKIQILLSENRLAEAREILTAAIIRRTAPKGQIRLIEQALEAVENSEPTKASELLGQIDKRRKANRRARERHAALTGLGLVWVRGALGGVYYE